MTTQGRAYAEVGRHWWWLPSLVLGSVAAGLLARLLIDRFGDLGIATVSLLFLVLLAGVTCALWLPILSVLACIGVAFSSSDAILHDYYGIPLLTKYLPPLILAALALKALEVRLRPASARAHRAPRTPDTGDGSRDFLLCLSLLGVYYVVTLIPLLYASNVELAMAELDLQTRNLLIGLALALAVGNCGRFSDLRYLCPLALVVTTGTILLAILGSIKPSLAGVLPGFLTVYHSIEPGSTADRLAGAFGHPNTLGRYAVFMMPVAVGIAWIERGPVRWASLTCLLVLIAGVVLSESRGALLVMLILGAPASIWLVRRLRPSLLIASLGIIAIVTLVAWQYVDTTRMQRSLDDVRIMALHSEMPIDGATRGRLSEMRVAYELWKTRPLLGVGLANYEHYFQMYSFEHGNKLYNDDRSAHSLYLELLAERGLLGLAGFALAIIGIVTTVYMRGVHYMRSGRRRRGILTLSLVVSAFAYYLSAVLLHDVHSAPLWGLMGLLIGSMRSGGSDRDRAADGIIDSPPVDNTGAGHRQAGWVTEAI